MVGFELLEEKETTNLFEEDEERESEVESLDLHLKELKEISGIIISGTDWTTETILHQIVGKNIELNPRFQRRDGRSSRG